MEYGFIGCGNMGSAIVQALSRSTHSILLSDRSGKAKKLANSLDLMYGSIQSVAESCDCIFLAVKPQMMETVITQIRPILLQKHPLIITMAAGLHIEKIIDWIGYPLPVLRIMPNTPVAVGKGMILYSSNHLVTDAMLSKFLCDMQYAGSFDQIDETLIDIGSAVSGSGPAYMYLFLEAMADGAVACGLPRQKAITYAAAAMEGAANMILETGKHPGSLKDAVCSPGGSTIEGIRTLEESGFRGSVMDCVISTYQKNIELGK